MGATEMELDSYALTKVHFENEYTFANVYTRNDYHTQKREWIRRNTSDKHQKFNETITMTHGWRTLRGEL